MTLKWAIVGTGRIAGTFASALHELADQELVAVCSRSEAAAQSFASAYGEIAAIEGEQALAQCSAVDAVYIATPHPNHVNTALSMLDAGKHVLCEKPMAMNHAQTMAIIAGARARHRFLMEAFMYRVHPQTQQLLEVIERGEIGEIRHVEAHFGYHAPHTPNSRLYANALGGGGILDVGCYPMSFARLLLGEPEQIHGNGHLGTTGVDEWAVAQLGFSNGATAHLTTSIALNRVNTATIFGSEGHITVANPWIVLGDTTKWSFEVHRKQKVEEYNGTSANVYTLEATHCAEQISDGQLESNYMSWQDSLNNAVALDRWRAAIDLTYAEESAQTHRGPLVSIPRAHDAPKIEQRTLSWSTKPVSNLVMGCDNQPSLSHAAVMWDHFVEMGGNCFDTAHIYGGGVMEKLLGQWHQQRNNREQINIVGKGAHTPHCYPAAISKELDISLDRMQTGYLDLYFLHRDNLDIPVAEFVDALEEQVQLGRIRAYGGSNWSMARVREANAYAAQQGYKGFQAISNNFSLAYMEQPVWPGVAAVNEPDDRQYLADADITLMPWSSQARGFFTAWGTSVISDTIGTQAPVSSMQPDAAELKRVWFSERNFARRKQAEMIAAREGVELINVALAYVLAQPFPTLPIIGPRIIEELESSAVGSAVKLSAEDIAAIEAAGT